MILDNLHDKDFLRIETPSANSFIIWLTHSLNSKLDFYQLSLPIL